MLSESVDALVVIERTESLAYGVCVGVLYRYRLERPFGLLKYFLAFVVEEGYLAGLFVDSGFYGRGFHPGISAFLACFVTWFRFLRNYYQA